MINIGIDALICSLSSFFSSYHTHNPRNVGYIARQTNFGLGVALALLGSIALVAILNEGIGLEDSFLPARAFLNDIRVREELRLTQEQIMLNEDNVLIEMDASLLDDLEKRAGEHATVRVKQFEITIYMHLILTQKAQSRCVSDVSQTFVAKKYEYMWHCISAAEPSRCASSSLDAPPCLAAQGMSSELRQSTRRLHRRSRSVKSHIQDVITLGVRETYDDADERRPGDAASMNVRIAVQDAEAARERQLVERSSLLKQAQPVVPMTLNLAPGHGHVPAGDPGSAAAAAQGQGSTGIGRSEEGPGTPAVTMLTATLGPL